MTRREGYQPTGDHAAFVAPRRVDPSLLRPDLAVKLRRFAKSSGIAPADAVSHLAQLYPTTTVKDLADQTGIESRSLKKVLVTFGGVTLRTQQENSSMGGKKAVQMGVGITAIPQERRSAISRDIGQRLAREGRGLFSPDRTLEQKSAASKKGGDTSKTKKAGIHGLSEEERRKYNREAGKIAAKVQQEKGLALFGLTEDQRREAGIAGSRAGRKIEVGENQFDSYLEAAVGALLEKYIPDFKLVMGETLQVVIDNRMKVDFIVQGVIVEYNPVVLSIRENPASFQSQEEYDTFKSYSSSLAKENRKDYVAQVRQGLKERYTAKRREALNATSMADKELVVATTPDELYDDVLTRFGSDLPDKNEFGKLLEKTAKEIKKTDRSRMVSSSAI